MGLSAGTAATITAFLLVGFLLAGLLFQPKVTIDAWQVKESDFPMSSSNEEKLKFLLNYAILAPSSHNSQPWKFNVSGDEIKIFSDKTRWLTVADADQREFYLSFGCALENLLVAADHFGYLQEVHYFPDPDKTDLIAIVKLVPGGQSEDPKLFQAILARQINARIYETRTVAVNALQLLESSSGEKGFEINLASDAKTKNKFGDLVVRADKVQFDNVEYKSELGYWLGQGAQGPTGIQAKFAQFAVLFLDTGKDQIRKDDDLLNSTSVLGFISSKENDRVSQVKAGLLFERFWLTATALNLSVQPMSQVLEVPETKSELMGPLPQKGIHIQQAFSFGYASPEMDRLPRRSAKEVLI